jgi:protein-disulfide isomerase
VLKKYPTEVKVVFKNYPIRSHKNALNAAMAALAADGQGKFWEFHDELFKHYKQLNEKKIQDIVNQLGLDKDKFESQRRSPKTMGKINQDYKECRELGIKGVPTVYINGKKVRDLSLKGFQSAIKRELKILQTKKQ